jgi:hypothetical protein
MKESSFRNRKADKKSRVIAGAQKLEMLQCSAEVLILVGINAFLVLF